jgi:hypothetical protein
MIKAIISFFVKALIFVMTSTIVAISIVFFILSYEKLEVEKKLNHIAVENKSEINKIIENRLSLDFDFEDLIISYDELSLKNIRIKLSIKKVRMAQIDDPLPVYIDELNIIIDLLESALRQIPAIKGIEINGSDIQFSHNNENGYMINNIPITQFKLPKRKGFKRPSLELRSITAKAIDIEHLQETVGLNEVIESDDATFSLNLKWNEVPRKQEVLYAEGNIDLLIMDGVVNTKDPIPGKALSLFSFSQLPKRVFLDFGDVLNEGLVFDYIKGEILLNKRTAFTCNLSLNTKTVDVLFVGASNLEERTYDQMMIIDPDVSDILTGGAAVFAGPAAAASMFLLSKILGRPEQDKLNYFNVSGDWKEPIIEPIKAEEIDQTLIENCEQFLPDETN